MERKRKNPKQSSERSEQRDTGMPGDGAGRTDTPGRTGVYPVSSIEQAPADARIQGETSWGQGDRGAAGYQDSGSSELSYAPADLGKEPEAGAPDTAEQRE
jgi:hypothetical protein